MTLKINHKFSTLGLYKKKWENEKEL